MNAIDKIKTKFRQIKPPIIHSGFLHPDGSYTVAPSTHSIAAWTAKTTLRAYFKLGGLRVQMRGVKEPCLGIEGKRKPTLAQITTLERILRDSNYNILAVDINSKYKEYTNYRKITNRHLQECLE